MRWRPLIVVLLAVTAGCNSVFVGESGPEETATPAPVPELSPATEHSEYVAPGIRGGDVADAGALARAHVGELRTRSYVWTEQRSVNRTGDDSEFVVHRQRARVESDRVYALRSDRSRIALNRRIHHVADHEEYVDGQTRHVRYRLIGSREPEFERFDPVEASRHRYIGRQVIGTIEYYLGVERTWIGEATIDGRPHYRIDARTTTLAGVEPVSNYTARAYVTPEGFVRSLRVSYRTVELNETKRVTYAFEYSGVNETTVEEPDWVPESTSGSR